jgi:hypothetical protein
MKLNTKDSTKEMSSQQQVKRDKSVDPKEKLKQEKLQKEKEKKERERVEKERKEREKREKEKLEKERKEREKLNKKGGSGVLTGAATSSDLNRINSDSQQSPKTNITMTNSKSENVLSKLRKQTSLLGSSGSQSASKSNTKSDSKNKNMIVQSPLDQQQPLLPKGRFRCQVVYLDESVKTFDLDVSFFIQFSPFFDAFFQVFSSSRYFYPIISH